MRAATMTEEEWLTCTDPTPMLEFLRDKVGDRRLRLFAVACCRRVWRSLKENGRRAVEAAEGFADGLVGGDELREAGVAAYQVVIDDSYDTAYVESRQGAAGEAAYIACREISTPVALSRLSMFAVFALGDPAESVVQCGFLREINANPFRPPRPLPATVLAWDGGIVEKIARGIYNDRGFDRLPVLADALEDAGCTDADILAHCRDRGPHVRGCWVVDLLLGKS